MIISYSSTKTGPWDVYWYRDRGLIDPKNDVVIPTRYTGGTINISGLPEDEYPSGKHQYNVPIMHDDDWKNFSKWLTKLETYYLWEYRKIIFMFEETIEKDIRWWNECEYQDKKLKLDGNTL